MALNVVILNRRIKGTFMLVPEMVRRIKAFEDDGWTEDLAEAWEETFCRNSPAMVGIAFVDEKGIMRGHCVAGIETFAGHSQAVIYQLAKDKGYDDEAADTNRDAQAAVEAWAHMAAGQIGTRLSHIMMAVKGDSRSRLFERLGYENGPRLMRKEL